MPDVGLILDTDAMVAYSEESLAVGTEVSKAADKAVLVLLPALCLSAAYHRAEGEAWRRLEVLASLPQAVVAPVDEGLCPFIGGWAKKLGRLDIAHAALEAASHTLVTLITSKRELMTRILPKEWPIIDL